MRFNTKILISLEPGYYEDGNFGIRLENIIRIVPAVTKHNFANRGYLTFEDVTLVPIQQKMIMKELLNRDEVKFPIIPTRQCKNIVGQNL